MLKDFLPCGNGRPYAGRKICCCRKPKLAVKHNNVEVLFKYGHADATVSGGL